MLFQLLACAIVATSQPPMSGYSSASLIAYQYGDGGKEHLETIATLLGKPMKREKMVKKLQKYDKEIVKKTKKWQKLTARCGEAEGFDSGVGRRRVPEVSYSEYAVYSENFRHMEAQKTGAAVMKDAHKLINRIHKRMGLKEGRDFVVIAGHQFIFELLKNSELKELLELQGIHLAMLKTDLDRLRKKNRKGNCD